LGARPASGNGATQTAPEGRRAMETLIMLALILALQVIRDLIAKQ
jgi:hypothetical protein